MHKRLPPMLGIAAALSAFPSTWDEHYRPSKGSTPNKYMRHQGRKECARRLKQQQPPEDE